MKSFAPSEGETTEFRYRTKVLMAGKAATGIEIPEDVITKIGAGRKPPVRVTVNGFTYRSTVAVRGGRFLVGINADNRAKAKIAGGDTVDVSIALDTEVREVILPAELEEVLNRAPRLKTAYESLSYTKRRIISEPIASAKTDATRLKRIEKAIDELKAIAATSGGCA